MKQQKQQATGSEATTSSNTTSIAKPTLAESQRRGAEQRASEAAERVERLTNEMGGDYSKHPHGKLLEAAKMDAHRRALETRAAATTADAQYASRKAEEAAAAAAWLFGQR